MANVTLLEIKGSDRLLDVSAMGVGAGQSEILWQHRFIVTLCIISPSVSLGWEDGGREGPRECSVGKVLAVQPWQPKFSPQNPWKSQTGWEMPLWCWGGRGRRIYPTTGGSGWPDWWVPSQWETDSVSKIKLTGSWRMTFEFVLWSLPSVCLPVPARKKIRFVLTFSRKHCPSTVHAWDVSILTQWNKIEQLETLAEVTHLIHCLRSCIFSTESVSTAYQRRPLMILVRSIIASNFYLFLSQKNCKSRFRGLTEPAGVTRWGSHI